jgi:hypothetical protein
MATGSASWTQRRRHPGALDRLGVAQDTLVLFTSDNGGVFRRTARSCFRRRPTRGLKVNGPLKGGKHTVWEGGFKVPFIVRWPGKVSAGSTCSQMISLADVLATTAAIEGDALPAPDAGAEDSVSFLPALLGDSGKQARESMIVHSADGVFAIRKGPWKWIEASRSTRSSRGARKTRADEFKPQLYNTVDDPGETKDVSAAHPEVVAELKALLNRYRDGGYSRALPPPDAKPKRVCRLAAASRGDARPVTSRLRRCRASPGRSHATCGRRGTAACGAARRGRRTGRVAERAGGDADGVIDYEICFNGARPPLAARRVGRRRQERQLPRGDFKKLGRNRQEPVQRRGRGRSRAARAPRADAGEEGVVSGARDGQRK